MTTVQVPVNLGGTGTPYTDDTGPFGMKSGNGYGYVTYFFPMVSEVVAACQAAVNAAGTAVNAPGTSGTSTTSLTIGIGTQTFTTQTGKNWVVGQPVMLAMTASPTNWMAGTVTAYDSTSGAMSVATSRTNGAGTAVAWTISLTGPVTPDDPQGQCRLTKSGANLLLSRLGGSKLFINGANQVVPAAGVTLAPTGAVANTVYYIYAFMNAGVMTLEFSTTAPAGDATYGHRIKTGDATRSLVGMARAIAGPAWVDTDQQRFVISHHNRRPISGETVAVTITAITTTSAERTTANRAEFLTWGDEAVTAFSYGNMTDTVGAAGLNVFGAQGFDGTIATNEVAVVVPVADAGKPHTYCAPKTAILSEGYHYSSTHARTSTGSTGAITAVNQLLIRG